MDDLTNELLLLIELDEYGIVSPEGQIGLYHLWDKNDRNDSVYAITLYTSGGIAPSAVLAVKRDDMDNLFEAYRMSVASRSLEKEGL